MQKKVLAAAIGSLLLAPAAFADVSISGRLATGLENYDVDAPTADSELRISDQSSSLVFSGSEDLGGGLQAWFRIDNRFSFPDGSFGASGNTLVGLQGSWGKLGIGRSDLHYNEMFAYETLPSGSLQTRVTGSVFSQVGVGTPFDNIANGTRTPNVIMWDGAFGSVTARVAYSTSGITPTATESALEDEGDVLTAALRWSSGPLAIGASLWSAENDAIGGTAPVAGGVIEQESVRAWVAYTFGAIKAAFGVDQSSLTTPLTGEVERLAFVLPVTFTSGANSFYVGFGMADDAEVAGTDVDDSGATIISVGYNRALSKRTHIGVYYTDLSNDDNASYNFFANSLSGTSPSTVGPGTDASQLYFGVAHFY